MLIEIKHSPGRGRGVFARTAIPKDTVIECAATLPLTPHEQELIAHTQVNDYLFTWCDPSDSQRDQAVCGAGGASVTPSSARVSVGALQARFVL